MRLNKPLALAASASLLVLAACGGGGGDEDKKAEAFKVSAKPVEKNAEAHSPAPEIEDAHLGCTITPTNRNSENGLDILSLPSVWTSPHTGPRKTSYSLSPTTNRHTNTLDSVGWNPDTRPQ